MESEVKILVPPEHWDALFGVVGDAVPEVQQVWFFDTAERQLYAAGVILRTRIGAKSDTTVKLRGVAGQPPPDLGDFQPAGLKDELDCTVDATGGCSCVRAVSLKAKLAVVAPMDRLAWFAAAQLELIRRSRTPIAWGAICRFGPIQSTTYDIETPGAGKVVITRWEILGNALVEVSLRTDAAPEDGCKALVRVLQEWNVPHGGIAGGKTSWALQRLEGQPEP